MAQFSEQNTAFYYLYKEKHFTTAVELKHIGYIYTSKYKWENEISKI